MARRRLAWGDRNVHCAGQLHNDGSNLGRQSRAGSSGVWIRFFDRGVRLEQLNSLLVFPSGLEQKPSRAKGSVRITIATMVELLDTFPPPGHRRRWNRRELLAHWGSPQLKTGWRNWTRLPNRRG